jgi:hypothetical protein
MTMQKAMTGVFEIADDGMLPRRCSIGGKRSTNYRTLISTTSAKNTFCLPVWSATGSPVYRR